MATGNEGKGKEKKKERGDGKEGKKKRNSCTLSFYNSSFGRKKVYLAITLPKIRLGCYFQDQNQSCSNRIRQWNDNYCGVKPKPK